MTKEPAKVQTDTNTFYKDILIGPGKSNKGRTRNTSNGHTKNMKSLIASIAILGVVGLAVGTGAGAASTATVAATVTAELISVSVVDGSVAYGILSVDTNEDTVALSQTQVVTNDSNVTADLDVKSSDAVGGTDWDLVAAVGSLDEFTHEFSSNGGGAWTSFNVNNAVYTSLTTNVAAAGTQNLDLRIKTPTSVTDNDEKTITVTVLASAS